MHINKNPVDNSLYPYFNILLITESQKVKIVIGNLIIIAFRYAGINLLLQSAYR